MSRIVAWVRKRTSMAVQAAQALPNAVGNLVSMFSPPQLYALHYAHYNLLLHLQERGDEHGIRLLAEAYQLHPGYQEPWRPAEPGARPRPYGETTIPGFKASEPHGDPEAPTIEQWAERTCLHAHEANAAVIVVGSNHGGSMAATVLRSTWESLIANGKLPSTAELPLIQEATARRVAGGSPA